MLKEAGQNLESISGDIVKERIKMDYLKQLMKKKEFVLHAKTSLRLSQGYSGRSFRQFEDLMEKF